MPTPSLAERLTTAPNLWLATVRENGRPHLVPIWFVIAAERWYICTSPASVKGRNLAANPHVALALEDGNNPYVLEGTAQPVTPSAAVRALFKAKYDWDVTSDAHYTQVYEITPRRVVLTPEKAVNSEQ